MQKQAKSNERMKAAGYLLIATWFPKKQAKLVKAAAKRESLSAAAIVRRAVQAFLNDTAPE